MRLFVYFVEEVPGFAVLVELRGFLFSVREEAQRLHGLKGAGRKDIPDIFGHDISDEQINFVCGVGAAVARTGANMISAARGGADAMRGLDLHS